MWSFFKKRRSVPLAPRTVFLIKHDKWLELHTAEESNSGYYVKLSESSHILLLSGGRVIGSSLVIGWLPHLNWPADCRDQFDKLKENLANANER
jgi:hypothetical protein